jgi:ABC-type microcin C transport system duplicated ATPase subunit YejF
MEQQDLILEARNIAVSFKVEGGKVDAVKNMSFALRKGETIAHCRAAQQWARIHTSI